MARRLILLAFLVGCGDAVPSICARPASEQPVPYDQGMVQNGSYMTADWDGEWLHFGGGAFYEMHHHLGSKPRQISCYLSFERYGTTGRGSSAAAGNQVVIAAVDSESFTIVNATCVEFWIMCTAR